MEGRAIAIGVKLGDLLIGAGLVTRADVSRALGRANEVGGRLGENLVAIGALERETLNEFLHRIPREPHTISETGVPGAELLELLMKLIYVGQLEAVRQFGHAIKLSFGIVQDLVLMGVERKLFLTEGGKRYAEDALVRLRYTGPAPVSLEDFTYRVSLQKPTNEVVTEERIREGLRDLVVPESLIEQSGPALNSGRAILFYGAPGNGKTMVARGFASVFRDVVYMPHAVTVDGQIIRVFDPNLHQEVRPEKSGVEEVNNFVRTDEPDGRWVACRRPFVMTGGELTLEMLDLRYDPHGKFYEAPLHMKALGGCFMIDDFGRQLVSPTELLNRWIVPLENRVDYLKLHTGKTLSIPFEELVIFSTNLEPEDLMDPAFLRRLPYKIEVTAPDEGTFRAIFNAECVRQGLKPDSVVYRALVEHIRGRRMELAAYQPRFILEQVVATCRFMGQAPHFEPRFLEYAIGNLRVRPGSSGPGKSVRV